MTDIVSMLRTAFVKHGGRVAYKIGSDCITYGELSEKSERYADLLRRQGDGPVILYGHKSVDMFVGLVSCLLSNRAYVPVDRFTPTDRIRSIDSQTGASLMICTEPTETDFENISVCHIEGLGQYIGCETNDTSNNRTAYIIFTSGSTGKPKGVPITYSNLASFTRWINGIIPLSGHEHLTVMNQASFSFDLSIADIFFSLSGSHTLIGLDRAAQENYDAIFTVIRENCVNLTVTTPTFMKMCLLNGDFNTSNYPSLRCMYFCGEVLDKKTVRKIYDAFPDIMIVNAYGPTEATSAVAGLLIKEEMLDSEESLPVGELSTAATEIAIEEGEITLRGESVFEGYIGGAQGGHFRENGIDCYRTGDLGYIQNDLIYYVGRKDCQIKYKGYRIELGDVESNIQRIKGVRDCAVVAKRNDDGAVKAIKAFAVLEEGYSAAYVRQELCKKLPEYMIPKTIKQVDRLPVNSNGKIDRKLLGEI